jgi:histidinol-phosphate phosphatase family protein
MRGRSRNLPKRSIEKGWTLFLDRDGVINRKLENDYIKSWEEFEFLPGVTDALKIFSVFFGRIFIVTNQQGIGKGIMTHETLEKVHVKMSEKINEAGGRIDRIYYCPDMQRTGSLYRKPNIGMALQARKEFPGIKLSQSVIAGDSYSDMQFGRNAGMITVLISEGIEFSRKHPHLVDLTFPDLKIFSDYLLST